MPPVKVITAGGAANSSKSRKPLAQTVQNELDFATKLEMEQSDSDTHADPLHPRHAAYHDDPQQHISSSSSSQYSDNLPLMKQGPPPDHHHHTHTEIPHDYSSKLDLIWLIVCFFGIMASFVCYGLLMEYTTSGGRELHELSFLFVTSALYTITAAAGRYVRDETPTTIPPGRFAVLGLTSMGSTFCSVRSLRYVIYPIQVLAKSCKPVPVMLMGTLMGKRYPLRKYINVVMIVLGVAMFMGGGDSKHKGSDSDASPKQMIGIVLLFISLCFDGGTGAYEDKLMSVHSVQPFDLMYNIQLGKTILAGIGLLVLNQLHIFIQMVQEMGFLLVALGLSGALGQVFIFVTIAKFGALTCSIIGLARKVTTLVASIYFYGHALNAVQSAGLFVSVASMVMNFWGKKSKKEGHGGESSGAVPEEMEKILVEEHDDEEGGDVELPTQR
ncbi:solute carrier family 35 (UDP-galactose transporter), member B1 [Fistulifera solaris]|uniref:Solute carrier family 35 (UDP-galactose transporter), member B1 n=1 Tax=Fistulifera solaris TaxID=1519565 RepID=A0A1Z5K9L8_FISSO|nr:solute carrier family 35 (UDP-galactose transporter), member B1 [Fistulifera solaris]|eukprot:GAX22811.1 solute carrier family 35 (UDP-galactose transporter), member B1 [Fistulifera solaris]